jgi:hypothetical protein
LKPVQSDDWSMEYDAARPTSAADRATADPAVCFESTVVERLAELKRHNPSSFERLRANLKSAGCRVTVLDQAIKKAAGTSDPANQKQADALIDLASAAELFHAPDRTGYADVEINMPAIRAFVDGIGRRRRRRRAAG